MTTSLKAALVGLAMAAGAVPALAQDGTTAVATGTVVASCYRGPLHETLWDRPEGVFLDSLVGAGYDYLTAQAIADRICKDESLVDDPEVLRAALARIMAASPARG